MSPVVVGIIGMILFLVMLAFGVHIGVAMLLVGVVGSIGILGFNAGMMQLGLVPYGTASAFEYTLLPLFIVMGSFAMYGGMAEAAYEGLYRWVCKVPGALAIATILACGAFGAASASSVASAAIFARTSLPEMLKYRYDVRLATGCVSASGTFSTMMPPSTLLVVYGIITEQSIAKLFLAGIIPCLFTVAVYAASIVYRCKRTPELAPMFEDVSFTWKDKAAGLFKMGPIAILALIVIGGLYTGVFTPGETGAAGAVAACIIAIIRKKGIRNIHFWGVLSDTTTTLAMIMAIMIGAFLLGRFLMVTRIPVELATFVQGLPVHPVIILACFIAMYFLLGMLLPAIAMVAITLPIVAPVIQGLGYNMIWFGIIVIKMCEIAVVTPPIGLNVYVVKGVAGSTATIEQIFAGIWPFVVCDLIVLAFLIAFPQIVLFLPNLLG